MNDLILLLLGFIGVVCHSLLKLRDLMRDAKAANMKFTIKDYWSNDWPGIVLSLLAVGIWWLVFGEVAMVYPKIENYIRLSYLGIGLTGSYAVQKIFNKSKRIIRETVDIKTDIADEKE